VGVRHAPEDGFLLQSISCCFGEFYSLQEMKKIGCKFGMEISKSEVTV